MSACAACGSTTHAVCQPARLLGFVLDVEGRLVQETWMPRWEYPVHGSPEARERGCICGIDTLTGESMPGWSA